MTEISHFELATSSQLRLSLSLGRRSWEIVMPSLSVPPSKERRGCCSKENEENTRTVDTRVV
jgi:hypothetical protein